MPLMQAMDHASHSYSLQDPPAPGQSLYNRITWQQQIGVRLAFQVAWVFEQRDGEDCLAVVNGLSGKNGASQTFPIAAGICTSPECVFQ